jgi:uroporphyrinogen III methyltransferase/synthase
MPDKTPQKISGLKTVGTVTLVGAGPGDPELITLKGRRALENADVVVYDRLIGDGVLSYAHPGAELIDVGKKGGCHPVPQAEIEKILADKAREGKNVVRLKGGDPFLFGRGGEEMAALATLGVPCEVVPGVTSAIAVPAYAGIPVTHRDHSSSLHIITAHKRADARVEADDYKALARLGGTLVFMMGASRLREISQRLTAAGMDVNTPAAIIENGATANQRSVAGTLASLPEQAEAQNIQAPAVIVVGHVVTLAEGFHAARPAAGGLAGKRVLVPRVAQKAQEKAQSGGRLAAILRARGAETVEVPVSRTEPTNAPLPPLAGYSWVVFTSAAGVENFFQRLRIERRDIREVGDAKIAAVGPATGDAIWSRGLRVDLVPDVYSGAALGESLRAVSGAATDKSRLLLLRAEGGAPYLAKTLADGNLCFDEIPLYRTVPVQCNLDVKKFDVVSFTCASSVQAFTSSCPGAGVRAACIGEQTAKAAKEAGYEIYIAKQATLEDLADAVENACGVKRLT